MLYEIIASFMTPQLEQRLLALLDRLELLLPPPAAPTDWNQSIAYRWRKKNGRGFLQPVAHVSAIKLDDLKHIDMQRELIERNTRQFVAGKPANNVLLTGARGTGKSSLIKACLNAFAGKGLRLIEVDKGDLIDLPDIVDVLAGRKERFIIYCDDLSFEEGESSYKALKSALDGSVAAQTENVLIYATSNRRHLMPEYMRENLTYQHTDDGEVHPGDVVEEKISLSERFGLWVNFYGFSQEHYLDICAAWLEHFGLRANDKSRHAALQWALERGSRSGRVAWQFARDFAGRQSGAGAAKKAVKK
jgi:predicted AAA+ superfamily ATPase